MSFQLAKYATETLFVFPMIKRGAVDFATSSDWTPASGDCKISPAGGSVVNTTNLPVAIAGTGGALWGLTLTALELTYMTVDVQIVDQATKAVEDQHFKIYTMANASAKIGADLSDGVRLGLTALPNVASGAAGALLTDGTGTAQLSSSGGLVAANVQQFGGSAGSFATGIPAVNLAQWRGTQPNVLVSGRVDGSIGAAGAGAITAAAFAAGALDANALASDAVAELVAAVKALVVESNNSITLGQALSLILSSVAGVTANGGATFKDPSGTTVRISATVDGSNNRTAMSVTPSA